MTFRLTKFSNSICSAFIFTTLLACSTQLHASNQGFKFTAPSENFTFSLDTTPEASSPDKGKQTSSDEPASKFKLHQQPQNNLTPTQFSELMNQARQGNQAAQDQLIELNYWGFLPIAHQSGIWGEGSQHKPNVNPLQWENTEQRAIDNDQYAYALIHAYAHYLRWNCSVKVTFKQKFPLLFNAIQAGAEAGNANDQFSLGVMYLQFDSRLSGVQPGTNLVTEATQYFEKAARQGHALAKSALGQIAWNRGPGGRNDIEATRWFLASKENKISQDCLKKLLRKTTPVPDAKETFEEQIDMIELLLGEALASAETQAGANHSMCQYRENMFAIPELSTQYAKIAAFHDDLKGLLNLLKTAKHELFLSCVTFCEVRDRKTMMSRQAQPPCVAFHTIDKQEYVTFGEQHVVIAAQFMTYLAGIDEKFAAVDKTLKKDEKSYKSRLAHYLDELKEIRLEGLKAQKDNDNSRIAELSQKFQAQMKLYEEKKPLLEPQIAQIKQARKALAEVKEAIQGIIPNSAARDQAFLKEHSYLK